MKTKLQTLLIITATAFTFATKQIEAQLATNTPAPLTIGSLLSGNLPPLNTNSTVFADGKLELRVGAIQQGVSGSGYESQFAASYYFQTNFAFYAECVNGGVNSIDALHIGLEFSHPVGPVRLGVFGGGGRNLAGSTWEGVLGVRLSYVPLSETAPNVFLYLENFLLVDGKQNFNGAQTYNIAAGIGYRF